MLTRAQVERFAADGFLLGEKLLSDAEVDELCGELERVIQDKDRADRPQPVHLVNLTGRDDAPVWQIVNIWEASDAFRRLMENPAVVEEAVQLSGARELRLWHDQIQYKPASKGGVNMWHQDGPLWPILHPKSQISAWVALDDVEEDNGCMSMVPGSHTWGDNRPFWSQLKDYRALPPAFEGHEVRAVLRPVKRGHVHFHHSMTWHGSHENKSGRPRRAIALHYMTEQTTFLASQSHVMKKFVNVADGRKLEGEHFPLVWANGAPTALARV